MIAVRWVETGVKRKTNGYVGNKCMSQLTLRPMGWKLTVHKTLDTCMSLLFVGVKNEAETHLVCPFEPPLWSAVWRVQSCSLRGWQWTLTGETCALCPSPELHPLLFCSLNVASPGLFFALCYQSLPSDVSGLGPHLQGCTYARGQHPLSPPAV